MLRVARVSLLRVCWCAANLASLKKLPPTYESWIHGAICWTSCWRQEPKTISLIYPSLSFLGWSYCNNKFAFIRYTYVTWHGITSSRELFETQLKFLQSLGRLRKWPSEEEKGFPSVQITTMAAHIRVCSHHTYIHAYHHDPTHTHVQPPINQTCGRRGSATVRWLVDTTLLLYVSLGDR